MPTHTRTLPIYDLLYLDRDVYAHAYKDTPIC